MILETQIEHKLNLNDDIIYKLCLVSDSKVNGQI